MVFKDYIVASRQARYSVVFALPLLLLYEGLAAFLPSTSISGVRNGADVLLKTIFVLLGGRTGLHVFAGMLAVWGVFLVVKDVRRHPGPIHTSILGLMLVESIVYAALLGAVVSNLTVLLLDGPLMIVAAGATQTGLTTLPLETQLVVSLGAGLYEELLFRVLLVSGLLALGKMLALPKGANIAVAILVSALIFSGFHYVGPMGDQLTLPSFTFRAVAGVVLSGLYVARGFGVTAWAHALYDVGLAVGWQ